MFTIILLAIMIFSLDILSNDNPLVTFLVCLIALIISVAIGVSKEKKETEEYARRKGVTVEEIRELRTKWREKDSKTSKRHCLEQGWRLL